MKIRNANLNDASSIAKIKIDTWHSTYRGIVPDEVLDQLSYEKETEIVSNLLMSDDGTFCLITEDEQGELVGYAFAGPERMGSLKFRGEIYAIYVLEGYQGKGLGESLVRALVTEFLKKGIDSLILWVLAANPYCRFYESLQGNKVDKKTFEVHGAELELVAFGWSETSKLLLKKRKPTCVT